MDNFPSDVIEFRPDPATRKAWLWVCGGMIVLSLAALVVDHFDPKSSIQAQLRYASILFLVDFLISFVILHSLSVRIVVTSDEIVHSSILNKKSLNLTEVDSALFSSVRGVKFLNILAGRRRIKVSSYSFSEPTLDEIRELIIRKCSVMSSGFRSERPPFDGKSFANFLFVYAIFIALFIAGLVTLGVHRLHTRCSSVGVSQAISRNSSTYRGDARCLRMAIERRPP